MTVAGVCTHESEMDRFTLNFLGAPIMINPRLLVIFSSISLDDCVRFPSYANCVIRGALLIHTKIANSHNTSEIVTL